MSSNTPNRLPILLLGGLVAAAALGLVWQRWQISELKMAATQAEVERSSWVGERSELEARIKNAEKQVAQADDTAEGARARATPDGNRAVARKFAKRAQGPDAENARTARAGKNGNGSRQLAQSNAGPRVPRGNARNNAAPSGEQGAQTQDQDALAAEPTDSMETQAPSVASEPEGPK